MKHLKYITLMLLVVLSAACEQMQLPEANLEIKREKVTDITDQSAVIELEFYPIDATIQKVEAYYRDGLKKDMVHVSGFKYRVELNNLNSDTEYQVYYKVKNAFSSVTVKNFGVFRTAKNNKPSNVIDTVYHIDFRQTIGAWTVRNYMLPEGIGYVWRKTDQYGMVASAFVSGTNHASEAWLISSLLDLTSNTTAFLTFNQAYKYGDISQIAVKITTNGLDWTTLEVPVWPDGTSWLFINSGEIDITKYISATTQIAYAYTSSAEASPTWEIRDVLIKGNGTRIEEPAASVTAPTVVTSAVTQIAETTAVAGGNVTSDGGASVTERGVVYSTTQNPTTANSKVASGSGTGAFTCNLTGLQPNTTYYVRAYAKNDVGIAYGDEVSFTTKEEVIATPEYVDLGLSVKWATFNVGANKPEDYGDYFAWGETESKNTYSWSTYKWCNGSSTTLTKYCTSSSYGTVDNKKTLELSDDAAYANWGGEWRTPTDAELTELRTQCTWTWTTQNGVNGYKVTGTNGNSIFLPAAGYRYNSSLGSAGSYGYYWSSTLEISSSSLALNVGFNYSYVSSYHYDRYFGRSVRPVYGQQVTVPTVTTSTVTQITETTAMAGGNVTSDGGASVTERGVVYSTTQNPTTVNNKVIRGGDTGLYACNLTGLQPNTTYYVRAYAVNSKGTSYGEQVTFTTLTPIVVPAVMTRTITQITETTAVAGGNVTSDGGASVTERGVVYSTSTNPTTASNKVISGSGMGAFICNLTGLQPNTTYYVRAYAVNSKGTSYGEQVSFTTNEEVIATPEYVDLGLSVKWATFNVGANKPEDYGDYFAWGETEPKSTYTWSNYKWCRGSETTLTKYCNHSGYGTVDNKTTLELSDDVAAVNWGGKWRMPTDAEMAELRDQCTWTWTIQNGVNGYEVTSNSNGNSIFLPAAGWCYAGSGEPSHVGSHGDYLLSSQFPFTPSAGGTMYFYSTNVYIGGSDRCEGHPVRPVYGDVVDLGELPTISTLSVTNITETTAVAGVNITSDGGTEIFHRGVVYNTHPNPTISDSDYEGSYSGGTGSFTFNLTGLQPATTYYVRAFARNDQGTAYGEEVSFTTQTQKPTIPYFSVSETKKVTFSKGNLQYTQSTYTWSFAENQWDMIGVDNVTGGSITSDPTYGDSKLGTGLADEDDKVDLFGWSTSATNFGVSTSTTTSNYSGSFVDWGTNKIGSDAPNTWRTLTYAEWKYLLNTRPNASSLKGVAQVNGVNGLILLPDNWTCPTGVTFKSGFHSSDGVDYYAAYQTFTADQWSKLEAAGAVFLPAAGRRDGSNVGNVRNYGEYWSATEYGSTLADCLRFYSGRAHMSSYGRSHGRSVRLVKDL